jgi:very-short-patch-repair endonuclease
MNDSTPSLESQTAIAAATTATAAATTATARIQATLVGKLNLADFQNAVPLLRELIIVNDGQAEISGLQLRVESVPAFLKPRLWHIDAVAAGQSRQITPLDVQLDGALLTRLTEAEKASVSFVLSQGTAEPPAELARLELPLELLPRNQWGGLSQLPEMVAAFVQPNDPQIDRLLKQAAEVLRKNGKNPALDGYRGGAKRAWEQASGIWSAVSAMGLDYALPPASFEHTGQKVRGPAQIAESGLATCLDIALLFCAALEQAGLNPLLVFTKGHALAGFWLKAEEFSTSVVDDVTALRKRIKLNELVLFETTVVTHRPVPAFSHAAQLGSQQISDDKEDTFELAIDIRRARLQRIKPLASAEVPVVLDPLAVPVNREPIFDEAPDLPDDTALTEPDPATLSPTDRLARWQRKLLDLSLRNNLLNFRSGKKALKLEAADAGLLEDALSDGQTLKLLPRPDLMDGADPRDQATYEARAGEDVRRGHARDALKRREVFIALAKDELNLRLVDLYRAARATLQEGGSNTLYLAMGFLVWNRDDKPGQRCRAPLILVPVTLNRKSARAGFTLTLYDDEPRFNPTLIEMLRQDFKLSLGVTDAALPKDETGIDVASVWKAVSHAVKDIKGWEVTEEVVLAMFSFAKHLMWKDLAERTDQLRQNAVVRHLIDTPRESYPAGVAFPDPRNLDRDFAPEQTFLPLPADSSQLSAVMAAVGGKDFVLIGPPGTGKSQTIANLIAQCLAEHKRVLFVSEKVAALDVVYRRLREVGLGEFCLELHSSKARKLDVLAQLRRSWEAQGSIDAQAWRAEGQRLKQLRDQLNVYVERLHLRHANGLTIFEAIGRVARGQGIALASLSWPAADAHDATAMQALRDVADRLEVNAHAIGQGGLQQNPLAVIGNSDWSPGWQQRLMDAARAVAPAAHALEQSAQGFVKAVGLPPAELTRRVRDALAVLARVLPVAAGWDWRFVLRPDARSILEQCQQGLAQLAGRLAASADGPSAWPDSVIGNCRIELDGLLPQRHTFEQLGQAWSSDLADRLNQGHKLLDGIDQATRQLSVRYGVQIEQLNLSQLQQAWAKAEKSLWPMSWLGRRRIRATLSAAMVGIGQPDAAKDIDLLVQIRASCAELLALDLTGLWQTLTSRVDVLAQALTLHASLLAAATHLAATPDDFAAIVVLLNRQMGDSNALLQPGGQIAESGAVYLAAWGALQPVIDKLLTQGGVPEPARTRLADAPLAELVACCQAILKSESRLHAWCAWRLVCEEAQPLGLQPLAAAIERGEVQRGTVRELFETNYCRWWLNAVVDQEPVIRSFVSAQHEKRIADFRALDDHFTSLTRDWIRASLCAGLPAQDGITRHSEWGILRHEINKKKRHIPLRELMSSIPTALTQLTPCLLMSPLSIAQYLAADATIFDIVVFDEASQICVWDAIGAIARGKQVVMVGDPKQLPPTNFFDRAESEADEEDVEADLESILDECLGSSLPTMNLAWHYRSRHESLIAFSNYHYYGGALVTFPSPVTEDRAVSFHPVQGSYEKGGARINKPEARALVADLVARLSSADFRASKLTIGVVTFNTEQQALIEDLLDEERRRDPAIECYFSDAELEPVFVKNLESVQGDERDIMYFSITYGPDQSGVVSMNFGPMNREGGERRLNVAITRARHELRVFSSLRAEQMDLARTQAVGVRDLKHFLDFAERGPRVLAQASAGSLGGFESPFEEAVAAALARKGWKLHTQVGASAFRIDLAVVHPDAPGSYLTGVECDGATYHRSATARDRDKLREQVLRGLGWEILRVWSTDWWIDAAHTLEQLDLALQALLAASRAKRAKAATPATDASAEPVS